MLCCIPLVAGFIPAHHSNTAPLPHHHRHHHHHYRWHPPAWWKREAMCVHHYEGAWNANTGNGYYGGFQADWSFMDAYGHWALRHWGVASNWSPHAQLHMAWRGWRHRGWEPWPSTARICGLL